MATDSTYSHSFSIELAADGGKFLKGVMNVDMNSKKGTQKITSTSDPLPLDFFDDAIQLLKQIEALYVKYDGIKSIEFKPQ